jgi:hypothetical protein
MKIKKKIIAKKKEENNDFDYSVVKGLTVIKLNTRKFSQYDFDFTVPGKAIELPKILPEEIKDAIVKVTIKINFEDIYKINIKELENYIMKYCFLLKPIIPSIQKTKRVKHKDLTSDLSPIEAVNVWLLNKKHKDSEEISKLSKEIINEEGFNNG